jgi:hypothetical protein
LKTASSKSSNDFRGAQEGDLAQNLRRQREAYSSPIKAFSMLAVAVYFFALRFSPSLVGYGSRLPGSD